MKTAKKLVTLFFLAATAVLLLFTTFKVTPWLYTLGIQEHPNFTTGAGGVMTSYRPDYFEVLSDVTKFNVNPNVLGYLVKVKEQGTEIMVSYIPQRDVSTRITTWHSRKSKGFTLFTILFCEGVAVFFLYGAIRLKNGTL